MPKPRNKKKPFIATKGPNKEDHQIFDVIHRSQQDPLAADSDAPQRLLQQKLSKEEAKKRKEAEREFGVFYDDEYDYMQHMKSKEEFNQYEFEQIELVQSSEQKSSSTGRKLQLPKEVFASQNEEEIGMLNKAAPHKGPLLNWDPDIVETLDDEFQHGEQNVYKLKDLEKLMEAGDEICNSSDEENALDMILAKAQGENELSDIDETDDDSYEDYDSDEALDHVPSLDGDRFSNFSEEETKSKFTSYSMSSSVIRRNEQLTQLDDQFEKFMDQYDEDEVGALEMDDDIGGCQTEESIVMKQNLKKFEKDVEMQHQTYDEELRKSIQMSEKTLDILDDPNHVDIVEVEEDEEKDNFDCESILTTYSTIYNHPKLIKEPSIKPIRVSGKTGIPKDVLGKGLTTAALKQLDRENDLVSKIEEAKQHQKGRENSNSSYSSSENDVDETMTLASRVSQLSVRNKHESKEEKKARKQALKDLRRERRVERKTNRDAFKEEKVKQEKNAMNLKLNFGQSIKLL